MLFNYKNDPQYIDRYNSTKNWVRLLTSNSDPRALQSSELIEIQSMLYDFNKRGMDLILGSGRIIKGINPILQGETLILTSGLIYLEGLVIEIPETELTIPTIGTHYIGVLIDETIITEEEDPTLRDPNTGGDLWGQPGAHRLKWDTSIVVNNDEAFNLFKVVEGRLISNLRSSQSLVQEALSTFAYDIAGNFKVLGFNSTLLGLIDKNTLNVEVNTSDLTQNIEEKNIDIQRLESERAEVSSSLISLQNRLKETLSQAAQNPTATLLTRVNEIQTDISSKKEEEIAADSKITEARLGLSRLLQNIGNTQGYTEAFQVEISPGIAYINGVRINKLYNEIIEIPKIENLEQKIGVRFNYFGNEISKTNLLIVNDINRVVETNFIFRNILIENTLVDINLYYSNLYKESNIDYFEGFVEFINNAVENDKIVVTTNNNQISEQTALAYLRNYLKVEFSIDYSLVFKSGTNNSSYIIEFYSQTAGARWLTPVFDLDPANRFNIYSLGENVKDIVRLIGERERISRPLIRSNNIQADIIESNGVVRITKIVQGEQLFVEGRDFVLENPNQVRWLYERGDAQIPEEGTTYYINYIYNELFIKDVDYTLEDDVITFILKEPAIGGSFTLDYDVYSPVLGSLVITKEGLPEYFIEPFDLSANNKNNLFIATFEILGDRIKIFENRRNTRMNVEDINILRERVGSLERKLEELKLGLNEFEVNNFSLGNIISQNNTDITVDLASNFIGIGSFDKIVDIDVVRGGFKHRLLDRDNLISLTPINILEQYRSRVTRNYAVNGNNSVATGSLLLSPKESFRGSCSSEILSCEDPNLFNTEIKNDCLDNIRFHIVEPFLEVQELYNAGISTAELSFEDNEIVSYIQQETCNLDNLLLRVQIRDLNPGEGGYLVFFNNVPVPLEKCLTRNGTEKTLSDIKANGEGIIELDIVLDTELVAGTHLVEVRNQSKYFKNNFNLHNSSILYGLSTPSLNSNQAVKENLQEMLKLDTYQDEDFTSNWFPIYQTFVAEKDMVLNGLYLKIRDIDELRDLNISVWESNEFPTKNLLSVGKLVNPNVSTTGVSRSFVQLERPILIKEGKEYAFSLSSNEGYYEVYGSKIGELDVVNNTIIGDSFVDKGRLFVSNNGISLTELPGESIAFDLEISNFPTYTEEVVELGAFGNANNFPEVDSFVLHLRDYIPANTSIDYRYSIDGGLNWISFKPNTRVCINRSNSVLVQAVLSTNNIYVSPFISLDGASIVLFSRKKVGYIESPSQTLLSPFNEITIKSEEIIPEGTSIVFQYSTNNGLSWSNLNKEEDNYRILLNTSYNNYKYRITLLSEVDGLSPLIRNIQAYVQ